MNENRDLVVRTQTDLDVQRDPERVLEVASKAAKALQRVVAAKPKPVIINGEQYLEFEDWQTLGQFYGYAVRTLDAEPVEVNGVQGAKARAELVDFRTGEIIGGAVSYCMADEDRWAGRPWFQLASMAQTRAGAKAFRNRLAWIAVLAGYKATPYEEMTGDEKPRPAQPDAHYCPIHKTAFRQFTKGDRTWYSHKTPDGSWCNEDRLPPQTEKAPHPEVDSLADLPGAIDDAPEEIATQVYKSGRAGTPIFWPEIPEFKGTTDFLRWAHQHYKLQPAEVWALANDLTHGVIRDQSAIAEAADMTRLAELIRQAKSKRPEGVSDPRD